MSEVKLTIGAREYTVACAEGEEAHVTGLGQVIDEKLRQLGESVGTHEAQNLLFSALLLADDLHETKGAISGALEAQQAMKAELEEAKRETNVARGQHDQLKLTIAERETELEGLQSSQQRASQEVDDIRTELTNLREGIEENRQAEEKLRGELTDLRTERDAAVEEAETLRAAPAGSGFATLADDPDLAPSLERFADLLEQCADKLEGKAGNNTA